MTPARRFPWLIVLFLMVGLGIAYGGVSIYRDQHSGTPGRAKVSECTGGSKYDRGIHCRGTWIVGGDLVFGNGRVAVGRVEGAGYGDVGKTIDVRIHGTDHATVPSIATPIVLWVLGVPISLLCLWGLWNWGRSGRAPRELEMPPAIQSYLADLVRQRWTGKDPQPKLDALPSAMPPGVVQRLASGGPFGWLIEARLDVIDGRVALEALEDDRMSGPDHYRVWDDGTREELPNEWIAYSVPPNASSEEEEAIKQKYFAHNHEVQLHLRERGFGPP